MSKFGVVIFPGSNCDHDVLYVLKHIMKQETVSLWHKERDLQGCDAIIVPGGFSYGDYLRAGALAKFSPVMEEVASFSRDNGYVFGICNGFQILCEAGMLPGALLANTARKFSCKNIYLSTQNYDTPLTAGIPKGKVLQIPIAHAEGRYYTDTDTLEKMKSNGQILFRYCDENGNMTDSTNPNGSLENIAGICNHNKNVFGMMPHPERASDTSLANTDGLFILNSLLKSISERQTVEEIIKFAPL